MIRSRILFLSLIVFLLSATGCFHSFQDFNETLDLSGIWKFQLDPDNLGMINKWYNQEFTDSIRLPGTTDENEKGDFH